MGWQWHQLDHAQIIRTSLQTDNHASTSSLLLIVIKTSQPHTHAQSHPVSDIHQRLYDAPPWCTDIINSETTRSKVIHMHYALRTLLLVTLVRLKMQGLENEGLF